MKNPKNVKTLALAFAVVITMATLLIHVATTPESKNFEIYGLNAEHAFSSDGVAANPLPLEHPWTGEELRLGENLWTDEHPWTSDSPPPPGTVFIRYIDGMYAMSIIMCPEESAALQARSAGNPEMAGVEIERRRASNIEAAQAEVTRWILENQPENALQLESLLAQIETHWFANSTYDVFSRMEAVCHPHWYHVGYNALEPDSYSDDTSDEYIALLEEHSEYDSYLHICTLFYTLFPLEGIVEYYGLVYLYVTLEDGSELHFRRKRQIAQDVDTKEKKI